MTDAIKNAEGEKKVRNANKNKTDKTKNLKNVKADDFTLWLLAVLNEETIAEISGENEITVTDELGNRFKLKIFKARKRRGRNEG